MTPDQYKRRWEKIERLYVTCWVSFARLKRAIKMLNKLNIGGKTKERIEK